MRFFQVVLSGAALIAAAWALELNDVPSKIEPGKTYTITYSPKDNTPTTFKLRKGDPNDLSTVGTLTTTATGGSFQWTVDSSLTNGDDYAIEISQGSTVNYSGQITLTGGEDSSSAASSATPSATASSAASSGSSAASSSRASTITSESSASSASATVSPSASSNSTISSATLSRTRSPSATGGASQTSSGGGPPQNTGAASTLASSPLALIFGAVAAMAYLN